MRRRFGFASFAVGLLLTITAPATAGMPPYLNVQGVLRNVSGELVTGQYAIVFRIFSAEIGGEKLWEETRSLTLASGLFSVYLGPFPANPFADHDEGWLELKVGTDPPLPRMRLSAVGFAFLADRARQCDALVGPARDLDCANGACVSGAEVDFAWARGTSAGGAAADLDCADCVSSAEIANGAVSAADIGLGQVGSSHLAQNLSLTGNTQTANLLVTGNLYSGSQIDATTLRMTSTGNLVNIGTVTVSGVVTSTVQTGTAPFAVSSRTTVTNLSADLLDGLDSSYFLDAGHLVSGTLAPSALPPATTSSLGGVVVGSGLAVEADGTLSNDGVTGVSALAPIEVGGQLQHPVLSIRKADGSTNGYLSAGDWNAFNSRLAAVETCAISATHPACGSGAGKVPFAPLVGNGTTASPLGMSQASATSGGWLSAADWSAFNAKAAGTGGSGYIQNQTAAVQVASFRIDGTAEVGTSLTVPVLYDKGNPAYYVDPAGSVGGFSAIFAGKVGVGTTAPGATLDVVGGNVRTDGQFVSTATTGAPLAVGSSVVVANLNADLLDGKHATDFALADGSSTKYVQNQSAAAQSGSFWVSGTGKVAGDFSAGRLCLGGTCKTGWSEVTGPWTVSGNDIYNANTGYVGIGTTTPSDLLDVAGKTRVSASDGAILLHGTKNTRRGVEWYYGTLGAGDRYGMAQAMGGNLALYTAGPFATSFISFNLANDSAADFTELGRITHDGRMGLGTKTPTTRLQIGEIYSGVASGWPTAMTQGLMIGQDTDDVFLGLIDEGGDADRAVLAFGDNPDDFFRVMWHDPNGARNELLRILSDGRMGLGVTAPSAKLDVAGAVKGTQFCIGADCVTSWSTAGTNYWSVSGTSLYPTSTNLNIGIGLTSAPYRLTLAGGPKVFGVDNTASFVAKNSAGTYEEYLWPRWSDNVMYLNYGAGGFHIRNNASTSAMFFTNAGDVGLRTTNPRRDLHLVRGHDEGSNNALRTDDDRPGLLIRGLYPEINLFSNAQGNGSHGSAVRWMAYDSGNLNAWKQWSIGTPGREATFLDIGYAANEASPHGGLDGWPGVSGTGKTVMRLNSAGRVGIGTLGPEGVLHVVGGSSGVASIIGGDGPAGATYNGTGANLLAGLETRAKSASPPPGVVFHHQYVFTMFLQGQNSPRGLRVTGPTNEATPGLFVDGNVGVGTTGPAYRLDVQGSGRFTGETIVGNQTHFNGAEIWSDASSLSFHKTGSAATTYFCNLAGGCPVSISAGGVIATSNLMSTKDLKLTGAVSTEKMNRIVPFYIRGTGLNHSSESRIVVVGNNELVNTTGRGLTLTILKRSDMSHVSSTNYDTYGDPNASDALATALSNVSRDNLYILTSFDAWEASVTANLRAQFERLGLFKALGTPPDLRRPYVAVFEGAGGSARTGRVIEVEHSNDAATPHAELAGWFANGTLMGSGTPNALTNGIGTVTGLFVTDNGNVGVGTTTPDKKLTVAGDLKFTGTICDGTGKCGLGDGSLWKLGGTTLSPQSATYKVSLGGAASVQEMNISSLDGINADLQLQSTDSSKYSDVFRGTTTGGIYQYGLSDMVFATNGTERMRLLGSGTNDGFLGIGTNAPTAKLHVAGGSIKITDNGANTGLSIAGSWIGDHYDGLLHIKSGGSTVTFDGDDAVGIGTTAPESRLHVAGDLRVNDHWHWSATRNFYLHGAGDFSYDFDDGDGNDTWGPWDPVHGWILTARNTGLVGIRNSSPAFTLDVNGTIRFGGFTANDVDEWPNVIWYRGDNWDEGLIKGSSSRGVWGRAGYGIHFHQSRHFGFYSTGWDSLMDIEGGTGRLYVKGATGIGTNAPDEKLTVIGNMRVGSKTAASASGNWGNALILSGSPPSLSEYGSDNSDPMWLARYNTAANASEMRLIIGDDPGQAEDRLAVGPCSGFGEFSQACTFLPKFTVSANGDVTVAGTLTAAAFSGPVIGTIAAPKVSSGNFGGDTGGGNYGFPGSLVIGHTLGSDNAPYAKLDVRGDLRVINGTEAYWDNVHIWSEGEYGRIYSEGDEKGLWIKSQFEKVHVDSPLHVSGYVGIGTADPQRRLHVRTLLSDNSGLMIGSWGDDTSPNGSYRIDFPGWRDCCGATYQVAARIAALPVWNCCGGWPDSGSGYAGVRGLDLAFYTHTGWYPNPDGGLEPIERMRILNSGNVGIATSTPTEKLEVNGNVKAVKFISSGTSAPSGKLRVLSLYPNGGPSCAQSNGCSIATILANDGQSRFDVTCLGVNEFNNGAYNLSNFDVVVLDAADCWNCRFDTEEQNALRSFVNNGGGLVGSHDTFCCGCGCSAGGNCPPLRNLVDMFGLSCGGINVAYTRIYKTRTGDITNFPHVLPDWMDVQYTHTECGGITNVSATRWYEHDSPADDAGNDIALTMTTYGLGRTIKLGWGHSASAPAAGSDESKLIVNALYAAARAPSVSITTQGAVGIGTTTPSSMLDIAGRVSVNGNPVILWQEFATPLIREFGWNGVQRFNVSVPGMPDGARYILADVFITNNTGDHQVIVLGRGAEQRKNWVDIRGQQPSTQFGDMQRHVVQMVYQGDSDGYSPYYGVWFSSQVIPLNANGTFDFNNFGNNGSGNNGWVYMVIRAWSL